MKNPYTNNTLNLKRVVSFVLDVRKVPMKKELSLLVLLLVMSFPLLTLFPALVVADFTVIRVPADYPSIQSAINAAAPGSIILVSDGTYHEHLVVNKTLSLIGEYKETTIIDGNGTGKAVFITADSVVVDGFTIQNSGDGINLTQSNSGTITGNLITLNEYGIVLHNSDSNIITGNLISKNMGGEPGLYWGTGIGLSSSNGNVILGNTVTDNAVGLDIFSSNNNSVIGNMVKNRMNFFYSNNNSLTGNAVFRVDLYYSNNNIFIGNTITNEISGPVIRTYYSNSNIIYHNNFINPYPFAGGPFLDKAAISYGGTNTWDNSTEGNYWSDYMGLDDGSGGRVAGDGVGDTSLPHLELDNFPLTIPWRPVSIVYDSATYPVKLVSNSTVSVFRFDHNFNIRYNVTGPSDTFGFCNVTIPKNLLWGEYSISIKDSLYADPQKIDYIRADNDTHTFLYFTYNHSTTAKARIVTITAQYWIPEFPSILPLLIILTILTAILTKKKTSKTSN